MSPTVRLAGIVATLAIHAGVVWLLLHPPSPLPPQAPRVTRQAQAPPYAHPKPRPATRRIETDPVPRAKPSTEPAVFSLQDPALRAAYDAGADYARRYDDALDRARRDLYGDEIAAALRLPLPEAWRLLEPLALAGDRVAGEALVELAGDCLPGMASTGDRSAADVGARLVAEDAAFFAGQVEASVLRRDGREAMCAAADLGPSRLKALVEADGGVIERGRMGLEWIDVLEQFSQRFGAPGDLPMVEDDSLAAAIRRLADHDAAPRDGDLEQVVNAIDQDQGAVNFLTACFINGCERVPSLPDGERLAWSLRTSRLGNELALMDLVRLTEADGHRVSALAWAGYWRWSAMQGCDVGSHLLGFQEPAMAYARLMSLATPAEAQRATKLTGDFVARYGDDARRFQGCSDGE
jgi:hypothetical protein